MEPWGKCGRPRACQTPTEWPKSFSDPDTVPVTAERLPRLPEAVPGPIGPCRCDVWSPWRQSCIFHLRKGVFSGGSRVSWTPSCDPSRSVPLPSPRLSCWAYLGAQPYSLPPGGRQWAARAGAQREGSEVQGQVGLAAPGPGVTAPLSPPSPPFHSGLFGSLTLPCRAWHSLGPSYTPCDLPWIILIGKPSFLDFSIT